MLAWEDDCSGQEVTGKVFCELIKTQLTLDTGLLTENQLHFPRNVNPPPLQLGLALGPEDVPMKGRFGCSLELDTELGPNERGASLQATRAFGLWFRD